MEILTFDFDNSLSKMNAFREQTSETFSELALTAESVATSMKEKFLAFSQETNLAFLNTSMEIQAPFNTAYFTLSQGFIDAISGMNENTAALWAQLEPGFTATWTAINEGTIAFLAQLDTGFATTWSGITEGVAVFAAGLQTNFAALWVELENGMTGFWAVVDTCMVTGYASIDENSTALWARLGEGFGESWTNIGQGTDILWQSIETGANDLKADLTAGFSTLQTITSERFQSLWSSTRNGNSILWNDTDKESSSLTSKIGERFADMRDQVKMGNTTLWSEAETNTEDLIDDIYSQFDKLWKDIPEGMKGMSRDICDVLNKLLSWLVSPINAIIRGFNKIPFVNIPELKPTISPPAFARGGFPAQGQMFIAREAGPELVGTIGSRSAVVNNDQIIESVSRGVYDAVRAAMAGGRSGNGGVAEFNLYLDGNEIASTVERVQQRRLLQTNGAFA